MTPYIYALLAALAGLPSSPGPAAPPTAASCVSVQAKTADEFQSRWAPVHDLPPAVLIVRIRVPAEPPPVMAAATEIAPAIQPRPRHSRKRYRRR